LYQAGENPRLIFIIYRIFGILSSIILLFWEYIFYGMPVGVFYSCVGGFGTSTDAKNPTSGRQWGLWVLP